MPSASFIAHAGLAFANPVSGAAVDAAITALAPPARARILDLGCGSGEMLLRALRAHPGAEGLGVDLDADAIAAARRAAGTLPVHFEVADAAAIDGRFDVVVNVGASHALGGFPTALTALRARADVLLYGEGYWRREPSAAFLRALGGASPDELSDLAGLRAAIAAAGLRIAREWLATPADWARYEESLAATSERHDTPDTRAYAQRIRRRRALAGATDTLGFALLVLRA